MLAADSVRIPKVAFQPPIPARMIGLATHPLINDSIAAAVVPALGTVDGDFVLGIPLGIGKPNPFVNELYRRIHGNPARRLQLVTALSLEKPAGHGELERHFLRPPVEHVFGDRPDLKYVKDSRAGRLTPNIEVHEFFMKTGDYFGNEQAQQNCISTGCTSAARDIAASGMNAMAQAVMAQAVVAHEAGGVLRLNLSSNLDVSGEPAERIAARGRQLLKIAVINRQNPCMPNSAVFVPGFFDMVVDDPAAAHTVFGPQNGKVGTVDCAFGLHVPSLEPGDDRLKREQRRRVRFINTTVNATLPGAACSDAPKSGQVVSGVGGQFNFVAISHALPNARLPMMLRSTHNNKDGLKSSFAGSCGHVTIPRHVRDIVITEDGVADLRGQHDGEVIKRPIAVADSPFQDGLIKGSQAQGELEAGWELAERHRNNLPQALEDELQPPADAGPLPDFPSGTDFTEDEVPIVRALKKLKRANEHPIELAQTAQMAQMAQMTIRSLQEGKQAPQTCLERLGLAEAHSLRDLFVRRLFADSL